MSVDRSDCLISVIVPVYNVRHYLRDCIASIVGQTYRNLEIILVDDGSTDESSAMCDEAALDDGRIQVIHKENGGLSSARNAGLDVATGEFVAFVDSDDTIAPEAIEVLYRAASENGATVTMMNMTYVQEGATRPEVSSLTQPPATNLIKNEDFLKGICQYRQSCSFCDKMFKREVFATYRFTVGRNNEDLLLLSTMLLTEGYDVLHVDYVGYFYLRRAGSITTARFGRTIVDTVHNTLELLDIAKQKRPDLERYFSELVLYQSRTLVIMLPTGEMERYRPEFDLAVATIRSLRHYIGGAFFGAKDKLMLHVVCLSPRLAKAIISHIWKG